MEKLKEREEPTNSTAPTVQSQEIPTEANSFETNTKRIKDLRPITLEDLDYTYVPSYVPESFVKVVKPFFDRAKDICQLWIRALFAYRSQRLSDPIERFLPSIIKVLKRLFTSGNETRSTLVLFSITTELCWNVGGGE
ncbi:hypothetical protein H1D32_16265 [Anaerobacillus sp. CMMVII]|uniref:hypothetical protein n=1 Tax=Anaerobacillus sp. CMMVII TaxID=2755588 RepID=UPI0021B80B31|nr:hypothetical protein [Anaerobacillus sp. CMMVII]MCT8139119.1 hypothetical protein [Anaerobacillus sp. CMMVII]